MFRRIMNLVWVGLWTGFGVELSFLVPYVGWHFFYRKTAHKFDPEHIFHRIHDYFTN